LKNFINALIIINHYWLDREVLIYRLQAGVWSKLCG